MNKESIAKRVDAYIESNLQEVPFDKALPRLQKVLWDIADEEKTDGATIFEIYMDWKNKQ